MHPFSVKSITLASITATLMSVRGIKKRSLSQTGAIAAWVVGFLSVACGLRGYVLLMFYLIGSMATNYKKGLKETLNANASVSSTRGPSQVLACSIISVTCSVIHVIFCGEEKTINFQKHPLASTLACAILGHHATCLADTLASELGIIASQQPVLVYAPWKKVPPGTNGGITLSGTIWSCVGGSLMGLGTSLMDMLTGLEVDVVTTVAFGSLCGLVGSYLDSLLGATIQATYYDRDKKLVYEDYVGGNTSRSVEHITGLAVLSNVSVNLLSVSITAGLGGFIFGPHLFQ